MELFKLFGSILVDSDQANKSISKTDSLATDMGKNLVKAGDVAGKVGKTMSVALLGVAAAAGKMFTSTLEVADELQKMSDTTGVSASRLQELKFAGNQLGVELEIITGAQSKLIKAMVAAEKPTSAQGKAFKALKVEAYDANGKLRDSNIVFNEAITALGNMKNPTEQSAYAMQLFGKSGMELNPLIRAGGEEIKKLTKQANDMGAVLSDDSVKALDDTGDSIDAMKLRVQGLFGELAVKLLPTVNSFADKLKTTDFTPLINEFQWIIDHAQGIVIGITSIYTAIGLVKGALLAIQISDAFATLAAKAAVANTAAVGLSGTMSTLSAMGTIGLSIAVGLVLAKGLTELLDFLFYWQGKPVSAADKEWQGVMGYTEKLEGKDNQNHAPYAKQTSKYPGFASGVQDYSGGYARVNEEGGEIINLPNGSNVIPHDLSKLILSGGPPTGISIAELKAIINDAVGERIIKLELSGIEVQRVVINAINEYKRRTGGVPV